MQCSSSTWVHCCRSVKKFLIQANKLPVIPNDESRVNNFLWQTESNAFWKSIYATATELRLEIALVQSLWPDSNFVTVDRFERNPCCSSEIKPCRLQYCRISAEITRSINLQNTEVKAIERYNTIQYKTCNAPYVTRMLFVGADDNYRGLTQCQIYTPVIWYHVSRHRESYRPHKRLEYPRQ